MAKKKTEKNKLDTSLDIDDIDNINEDLDFGDLEDIDQDRSPSKAEISKELLAESGKGFLDSAIKKTANKALPEEFTSNRYSAMDFADFTKETFDKNKTKIDKSLYKLGKEVKKIIPFQSKMLDGFLEKYEYEFEKFKTQSEDEMRDNNVQSTVAGIFDKQLDIQKALEAKRSSENEVSKKQSLYFNKINLDVMSSIDGNVATQTAFTLQISKEFYRKSLELQYKSYFIQTDMLKTMRDYYKGFSLQFDNIVKNTGLPDFVKLKSTEALKEIARTEATQQVYKQVFSNSEYVAKIKKRMGNLVSDKIDDIVSKIDAGSDILENISSAGEMSGGSSRLIAGIAASFGGGILGEKLSNKISPKIKNKIKDNKYINAAANYAELLGNSPSSFFSSMKEKTSKKAEEYADESSPLRFLASRLFSGADGLLSVADPGLKAYEVKKKSILTHNSPAIFDNNVHRSITEVIPMYLSNILSETANFRAMYRMANNEKLINYADKESLVYDYDSRKLTTADNFRTNIQKSVFLYSGKSSAKIANVSRNIKSLMAEELKKDPEKNKKDIAVLNKKDSEKLFNNYLIYANNNLDSKSFTYDNLISNYNDNAALSEFVNKDENKGLASYLEIIKNAKLNEKNTGLNERVSDVRRNFPISPVKELLKKTSILSHSKTINVIKDDKASILAKAFYEFMIEKNSNITISTIINGKCFSKIPEKDFKDLTPNLQRLINEVKKISNEENPVSISFLELLVGSVSTSLREASEIDPEINQILHDYSTILQKSGKLKSEHTVEGKLGSFEFNDYVDNNVIRHLARTRSRDVEQLNNEHSKNDIVTALENTEAGKRLRAHADSFKTFKEEVSSDNSPKSIFSAVTKLIKTNIAETKKSGLLAYNEATAQFDKINAQLSKLSDLSDEKLKSKIPVITKNIIKELDKYISKIDAVIEVEENNKKASSEDLEKGKDMLAEAYTSEGSIVKFERDIKKIIKNKDRDIKALKTIKDKLLKAKDRLNNIDVTDKNLNAITFLKNLKQTFTSLTAEAKETLNKLESENDAQISEAVA